MAPRPLCTVHERPCMAPRRQLTAMVRQRIELYTYIFVKSSLATLFFWHVAGSNIVPYPTRIPDLILNALIWFLLRLPKQSSTPHLY